MKMEGGKSSGSIKFLSRDSMDASLGELRKLVMDREAWRAAVHGSDMTEQLTLLSCPTLCDPIDGSPRAF